MFEVGFWELILISVVALLVVGPEKLPGLARTAGLWMGRLRRTAAGLQAQLEREFELEEIRKLSRSADPHNIKHAIENEITPPAKETALIEPHSAPEEPPAPAADRDTDPGPPKA